MITMAATKGARHVVLTGVPGIGKTTLVRKACEKLRSNRADLPVQGFVTEELRSNGRRIGFDVVTLSGVRGPLARVREDTQGQPSRGREFRVGQYTVDVTAFEQLALPVMRVRKQGKQAGPGLYVIDEIGKMELGSRQFPGAVRSLLDDPSAVVLATIPVPKGRPLELVEHVRHRPDVTLFTVTKDNRDVILDQILEAIMTSL